MTCTKRRGDQNRYIVKFNNDSWLHRYIVPLELGFECTVHVWFICEKSGQTRLIFPNDKGQDVTFHTFLSVNSIAIENDSLHNVGANDEVRVFKDQIMGEFVVIPCFEKVPTVVIFAGSLLPSYSHEGFPEYVDVSTNENVNLHWGITNLNEGHFTSTMSYKTDIRSTLYIRAKRSGTINLSDHIFDSFQLNLPLLYFAVLSVTDVYTRHRKQIMLFTGMTFNARTLFTDRNIFIPQETLILRLDLLIFSKKDNVMVNLVNNAL